MRKVSYGFLGAALVAPLLAVAPQAEAGHGVWLPVARWEMNERVNATVLQDATGHFDGHIGKKVTPTDRRYHQFKHQPHKTDPVRGQIDKIPDDDHLDPQSSSFMVQLRFKWSSDKHDMNFVQKGQGSPAGGMFKVKTSVPQDPLQPRGGVKCLFRGSAGDSQVMSWADPLLNPGRLNDGEWHQLECERTNAGTAMTIDGRTVDVNDNAPGVIDNNWPITIGGNTYCPDTATEQNGCNYFDGKIDYVRFYDS